MSYITTNWQNSPSTNTPINAANLNHMEQGIYDATNAAAEANSKADANKAQLNALQAREEAATAADMTNTSKVYIYTGSEAGYTFGDWYYYNGSAWVSGGAYNSTAVNTDTTLSLQDVPADAKATGNAINTLDKATIKQNGSYISDTSTYSSYDDLPVGKIFFVSGNSGLTNMPQPSTRFLVMTYSYNGLSSSYKGQIALGDRVSYSRIMVNNTWSQWNRNFNYVTTVTSDFDNYRDGGMYHFADVSGIAHAPASSGGGSLIVFCAAVNSTGTGYITQIAQIGDRLWHRTLTQGSWTEWEIFVTNAMLTHNAANLTEIGKITYQYPFYAIRKEQNILYLGLSNYLFKYDISNPFAPTRTASVNFTGCIENGYYTTAQKTIKITNICANDDYLFCSLRYPTDGLTDMLGADAQGKNFGGLLVIDKATMSIVRTISLPNKCCWVDVKELNDTEVLVLTRMHHGFYVYDVADVLNTETTPQPVFAYDRTLISTAYVGVNDNGAYENAIDNMLEYQSAFLWVDNGNLYCSFGLYRGGVSTWDFTDVLNGNATEITHYDFNDVPAFCSNRTRKDINGTSHTFAYSNYCTYNATVYKGEIVGAFASAYSSIHGQAGDKSGIVYANGLDASDARIASLPLSLIPPNTGIYNGSDVGPTSAVVYHNSAIVNVGCYGLAVFYKGDDGKYVFEKNVPLDNDGTVNTFICIEDNWICTTAALSGHIASCDMILAGF